MAKLQADQLRIHAQELSKVWSQLDREREQRLKLEEDLDKLDSHTSPAAELELTDKKVSLIWLHPRFSFLAHLKKKGTILS